MVDNGLANIPGLLRLLEFITSLIAWACIVSKSYYTNSGNLVYGVAVLIIFWLLDLVWIIIFATGLYRVVLD